MASPRNAVITGAARGIGRAIAVRLAADGYNVVVNDMPANQASLDELVAEISSASGGKAVSFAADITIEQNVKDLVEKCVSTYGTLDVMVCNAGNCWVKPILDCTLEEMQSLFDTNFHSVWLGYQCAARQMIKQGRGGRIIGAGSTAAKRGKNRYPNLSAYSASKFAIRALTQAAAQEWGPHQITVNSYCPGLIMTPLAAQLGKQLAAGAGLADIDPADLWASLSALKRHGETKDLVGFVSFLASEEGGFVTGQSVLVDGGSLFD
ncbi:acetoin reductase family protein [Mycena vitilis]|nr:acetoin reductase family protein [Mycena vitilis]